MFIWGNCMLKTKQIDNSHMTKMWAQTKYISSDNKIDNLIQKNGIE